MYTSPMTDSVSQPTQVVNLRSRGGGGGSSNLGGTSGGTTVSYAPMYPTQSPSTGGGFNPNPVSAPFPNQSQQQSPYGTGASGFPSAAMPSTQFGSPSTNAGGYYSGSNQPSSSNSNYSPAAFPSNLNASFPSSSSNNFAQPNNNSSILQPLIPQPAVFQSHAPGELGINLAESSSGNDHYNLNRGPSQRGFSPALDSDQGAYSRSPANKSPGSGFDNGANTSDDRLRRKQNSDALQHYLLSVIHTHISTARGAPIRIYSLFCLFVFVSFTYGMISLSVFVMLVAWMTLGSASTYVVIVLSICIFSFVFTLKLTQWIFSKDDANPAMRIVSEAIREGSEGFLRVQYGTIAVIALIIAVVVGFIYLFRETPSKDISPQMLAIVTSFSYLVGAFCSGLAGYIGVWVSIRVNIRVAVAASKLSFKDALLLSFRGGAVSACLSASLCILGVTILYVFCYLFFVTWGNLPARNVPLLLVGYGFGGALVALFMQLGGGIYTKAADVGADMCGKVEVGIPEDDPRNPAVIADLVGDNVGDCAGSMADVFESIAAEVIGTMILGAALAHEAKLANPEPWIFFPLIIHALDLVISSIGIMLTIPLSDKEDPLTTMKRAYGACMALAAVGFMITCRILLYTPVAPSAWWNYTLCGWVGIAMSFCLIRSTQYYTDADYAPVKRIAAASQTGHGTNVIAGVAVGLESTCIPTIVIATALIVAFTLGKTSGLPGNSAGVFGTAVATMGMLCTAVFVLSMNNFGPIADNAGGVAEMSSQSHEVRAITDRLDSVGNVTKAASKGYAVGGSALSCFVLFQAFLDEITSFSGVTFDVINIAKVEVVCGGLLGMMMIFLFAGWSMQSVGSTAQKVVWEVRRQFKNRPGIMDGTEKPDYEACVAIVTREALKEMVWPALLALLLPVGVGFGFKWFGAATGRPQLGVEVIAGFMMFGTLAGLLMAMFFDNSGGAWDNAKKLIESQGLKGSEAHKAAVTGDTVGDPFKDTAGPALHVIITTMSTTILVLAPMFAGAHGRV